MPVLLSWERRAPARPYGNSIQYANQEIGVPGGNRRHRQDACATLVFQTAFRLFEKLLVLSFRIMRVQELMCEMAAGLTQEFPVKLLNVRVFMGFADCLVPVFFVKSQFALFENTGVAVDIRLSATI